MAAALGSPQPLRGVALALLAFAVFTVMDTIIKELGTRYPLPQILFTNSLFGLLSVVLTTAARGQLATLRTSRLRFHALRWLVSLIGAFCVFYCYVRLPLADVYAVVFTAPLLITALSVPLLGERVEWRRWIAILIGFLGVLVMLRPGGDFDALLLLALVGALAHAINMILVRWIGRTDAAATFGLYGNILTIVVLLPIVLVVGVWPTFPDLLLSIVAGAIAGSGFTLLAAAFRLAPAALVAPFQYSQMPMGLLSGWLIHASLPDGWMLAGAAIVIGSGVYILRGERTKPAPSPQNAAPREQAATHLEARPAEPSPRTRRAARIVVRGRVQGVGYREWAVAAGRRLGLDGWVRNLADGAVEMAAGGPEEALRRFVDACRHGPPTARVDSLQEEPALDPGPGSGFVRLATA